MNRLEELSKQFVGTYFSILINNHGYKIGYKIGGRGNKTGPSQYKQTFEEAYELFIKYMIKDYNKQIIEFNKQNIKISNTWYQQVLKEKEIYEQYLLL